MDKIKLFREVCSDIDYNLSTMGIGPLVSLPPTGECWELVEHDLLSLHSCPSAHNSDLCLRALHELVYEILYNKEEILGSYSKVLQNMADTYEKKNYDYGDSFGKSVRKYGFISCVTRLSDKYNRYRSLQTSKAKVEDEKMEDTLLDMLCYCVMTIVEIQSIYNEE